MKMEASGRWMSYYLLMRNSNQTKYGSLMDGLVLQYLMDHNQYPKTIIGATDVLGNHRYDNWNSWYNNRKSIPD